MMEQPETASGEEAGRFYRRYLFKLDPNKVQDTSLHGQLPMMADLWNAMKEFYEQVWNYRSCRRDDIYFVNRPAPPQYLPKRPWSEERKQKALQKRSQHGLRPPTTESRVTMSKTEISNEISGVREAMPEWRALSTWTARGVADSLLKSYEAYFRRMREMEDPSIYEARASEWMRRNAEKRRRRGLTGSSRRPTRHDLAGFPHFKRRRDATTIPHRCTGGSSSGSGCKFLPHGSERFDTDGNAVSARNWRLTLRGVKGTIRARGQFPLPVASADMKEADIIWRDGAWWLSISVEMPARRSAGQDKVKIRLDLIDKFARVERVMGHRTVPAEGVLALSGESLSGSTLSTDAVGIDSPPGHEGEGSIPASNSTIWPVGIDSPPDREGETKTTDTRRAKFVVGIDSPPGHEGEAARFSGVGFIGVVGIDSPPDHERSKALMRQVDEIKSARDLRYQYGSYRWRREKERAAKLSAKAARIRLEELHQWTTRIVRTSNNITVIMPAVKKETASPRGNEKEWGAAVKVVSMLNRSTLNQAPAMVKQMLVYKAAEAGIRCDIVEDEAPDISVGKELVHVSKMQRRVRRELRKED